VFDRGGAWEQGKPRHGTVTSAAADPGRGPGCSQTCAVATSPAPPPGQPVCTVSATGLPVPTPGRITSGAEVMAKARCQQHCPAPRHRHRRGIAHSGAGWQHIEEDRATMMQQRCGRLPGWASSPGDVGSGESRDAQPAGPGALSSDRPAPRLGQPLRLGGGHGPPRAGLQPWASWGTRLGRAHAGQPGAWQRARGQQHLFLGLSLGVSLMESVK